MTNKQYLKWLELNEKVEKAFSAWQDNRDPEKHDILYAKLEKVRERADKFSEKYA